MPRPSNTGERRSEIADALLAVMAEHGYDGASIQLIAKAARLQPGLVHYHFKDKREILVEAVRHVSALTRARLKDAISEETEPLQKVEAFIHALLARDTGDARLLAAWIQLGAESVKQKVIAREYQSLIEELLSMLDALVTGALPKSRKKSSREISAALLAAIQGYFTLAAAAPAAIPKGSAEKQVKAMARALLGGSP